MSDIINEEESKVENSELDSEASETNEEVVEELSAASDGEGIEEQVEGGEVAELETSENSEVDTDEREALEVLEASSEEDTDDHAEDEIADTEEFDEAKLLETYSEDGQSEMTLALVADSEDESGEENASGEKAEAVNVEGTELDAFESAEIEEEEFIAIEQLESIIESALFATDRPTSLASLKEIFKGTNITTRQIKRALEALQVEYASAYRGVTLEEVTGGYQLRTKVDNIDYLKRMIKARPFRLSGPAMEVLAITAYQQPVVKAQIDEIRGVESGHLLRALMEKGIVCFAGKSDLPGKPMLYGTTRRFLETFALKSLKELPSLREIDELLPEGIGEEDEKKEKLSDLTGVLSEEVVADSYSENEDELIKINDKLANISTSSDFFEEEKKRQREKRDADRAKDIQEALDVGEPVDDKDRKWLERRLKRLEEEALAQAQAEAEAEVEAAALEAGGEADVEGERAVDGGVADEIESENEDKEELMADQKEAEGETTTAPEASSVLSDEVEDLPLQVDPDDAFAMAEAEAAMAEFESDEEVSVDGEVLNTTEENDLDIALADSSDIEDQDKQI